MEIGRLGRGGEKRRQGKKGVQLVRVLCWLHWKDENEKNSDGVAMHAPLLNDVKCIIWVMFAGRSDDRWPCCIFRIRFDAMYECGDEILMTQSCVVAIWKCRATFAVRSFACLACRDQEGTHTHTLKHKKRDQKAFSRRFELSLHEAVTLKWIFFEHYYSCSPDKTKPRKILVSL